MNGKMAMPAHCLIVEDDPLQAEGLKSIVEKEGFKVCGIAASAGRAAALAEETHPDIAFIDIGLEDTDDGLEVAKRLRRAHPCRLVFVTGLTDPRAFARLSVEGGLVLHKPVNPALIAALLRG